MKFLKKFALLGLVAPLLFSLLSFTNVVAGEGNVVTIRVVEPRLGYGKPSVFISTSKETKNVDFDNAKVNLIEVVTGQLEQYYKEGYKIETSNATGTDAGRITTYILTK
jgi:hypothetical protein